MYSTPPSRENPAPDAHRNVQYPRYAYCGRFLSWLSHYAPADRQARRQQALTQAMAHRPPSQPQLEYWQARGDAGPVPASMLEASERIDALVRGEVQR